jgi:large subunit ribosomal protein L6
MSRIGKQLIKIPAGVEVHFDAHAVRVKGPKGELSRDLRDEIAVLSTPKGILTDKQARKELVGGELLFTIW